MQSGAGSNARPLLFARSLDSAGRSYPTEAMTTDSLQLQAAAAEQALAAGQGDAHDCMVAGLGRAALHDFAAAERWFDRGLALEPHNPAVLTGLAVLRRQQGRLREAVLACDAAIQAAPAYPDAWLERGAILAAGGSNSAARDSFAQAARLAPQLAAAHAGLAALAAREGRADQARLHAEAALRHDPANAVAICARASADLADGQPGGARAALDALLSRLDHPSPDRALARGLLGDACDRLDDRAAAYRAYVAAKADFAAVNGPLAAGLPTHREFVEAITGALDGTGAEDWPAPAADQPGGAAQRHVFLLGYPRSGTTLLENVLASLPGVAALEERPTLSAADQAYLMGDRAAVIAGLEQFRRLDDTGLAALRAAYWDGVVASGVPARTACFVDMDPLKGTRLPLIARLFPEARILIMRRDPRDVVWSCFRTQFAMTSGTLEYTSLERAARHYDALMRLTEAALARLTLAVHEVHYHRLVQDFDQTTREICAFIGLEWREDLRRFDRTADRRGVATASAGQVRRGLYDGTGQWQRYAEFLDPVLPILQPWIERFGYAGNNG